jgi:hypothetical protein
MTSINSAVKTVVISQPMYFPWPGFMAQMALADVYVWLDDVQFSKGSFTNRIQVRTATGRTWMTIPLVGGGTFQRIDALSAANEKWRAGHRDLIRQQFNGLPYLNEAIAIFDRALGRSNLVEVVIASCEAPANYLGILPKQRVRTSTLGLAGDSWSRVLEIVLAFGGTRYLTGHGAANYLDCEAFEKAGVTVEFMDYAPRPWLNHREPFDPYVTILEPIAHEGQKAVNCLNPKTLGWRDFMSQRGAVRS